MFRIKQWIKNTLVFLPVLFFPDEINFENLYSLIITFGLFCCSASLIYIVNDWTDKESDALNKNKKHRPFANKNLNFKDALLGFFFLFIIMVFLYLEAYKISTGVCILILVYLAQNFLYTFFLKRISIIEILIVSTGYSYRAFAGGLSLVLLPSIWMLITIFLASIFIIAQKRLADKLSIENPNKTRKSIKVYTDKFLNLVTTISAGLAIISYILFTFSDYAQIKFHNQYLPISSIFIIYSTFKYLHVAMNSSKAHDPINLIIHDTQIKICILLYFIFIVFTNSV